MTAKYLNAQDTDTRGFLLPNFPLRLSFVEPKEGQEVSGMTALKVETFGQGETIQSVIFQINGTTVATVVTTPYEAQVDLGTYPAGDLTIEAVAQGAGGIGLARAAQTVKVIPVTATPTPVGGGSGGGLSGYWLYILGGVVLLSTALIVVVILAILKKRKQRQRDLEWDQKVGGLGETPTVEEMSGGSDRTMDSWEMNPDALGMLTVGASDDPSMLGQRFEITNRRTTLGRKADNDIIFPKDSPVSRHHALVEEKNGGLFLSEVEETDDKTGRPKRPTYGTFVNENEVGAQSILLQNGDEVRLGKRVKLKFEAGRLIRAGDEKTFDGFTASSDTMETREM